MGQSLVEFALVLPVMLLMALIVLDFGRVYLGWVNLQQMTRAAANFAANNSEAWLTNDTATIAEYRNQVINDAAATNCKLAPTVPADPVFTDGNGDVTTTGIGDRATASFTCNFGIITPLISSILGNSLPVSASAQFPVKTGQFATAAGTGPTANFTASTTNTTVGTNITFTDTSTGSPTGWTWTFGDTTTSTVQNPVHAYTAAGVYTVALTVNNTSGFSTFTRTAYITVTNPAPPVADFTANKTNPAVSETVTFTATSTGSPTNYAWTFGDGGSISGSSATASHAYNTAGTYTVTLVVTAASGTTTVTRTGYITVAVATCQVPDFVGLGTRINSAQGLWVGKGFTTTVAQGTPHPNGNYKITFQSIVGNTFVACNSVITVNG